jgi:lipopolysaccharide transport system permease protein
MTGATSSPTHVIEAWRPGLGFRLREVIRHLPMLPYFGQRLVEKLYTRTWLGAIWLPLRTGLDVGMRVLLFGGLLQVPSGDRPYLVFFAVGMAAWTLFERSAYWATRSLELNRGTLQRLHIPRLIPMLASLFPAAVEFALYASVALVAWLYFRITDGRSYLDLMPGTNTLWLVLGLAMLSLFGLGIGLWTSVLAARARDVRFTFGYVFGLWFFITPVIYPVSAIPEKYRFLSDVNPIAPPVEAVKHGLLDLSGVDTGALVYSLCTLAVLLASGLWWFLRAERVAIEVAAGSPPPFD